jgi:virginiamycin B lyase
VPYLSRITTAGTFGNTFPLESDSPVPEAITLGPDGHLWFTTLDRIGKADASGNVVEFPLDGNYGAFGIAASNAVGEPVWFTEQTANRIGLITTDGEVTEFGGLLIPA